jgi:tRNA-specific 2-thiouridylase
VLAALGREVLSRVIFPLGDIRSKADVRDEAERRGLRVSEKPDSFDVCFIRDGNTAGFLWNQLGENPGVIVDGDGVTVGSHRGAYAFTVGQRSGLGIPRPAFDGRPRYVTSVDTATNTVVVGPEEDMFVNRLTGTDVVWLADDLPRSPDGGLDQNPCLVQVRAHGIPAVGRVSVSEGQMVVDLIEPMRRVASGQSLVVYDGMRVLGQATAS